MRLTELLDDACYRWSERVAFRLPDGDETWTYERVRRESDALAVGLQQEGVGPGDAIAILSSNSPTAFIAQLGILKTGAAYVPLNAKAAMDAWLAVLRGARATGLIFSADKRETAEALFASEPQLSLRWALTESDEYRSVNSTVREFMGARPRRLPDDREAPCWIMGSGGTTGTPKAVAIPQRAMVAQALALVAHAPDVFPVQLVSAPLTHAAGGLTFPVLLQGGETLVFDGARPAEILAAIEKFRVTRLFMPPTAIYAMLASPEIGRYDYSSLTYFLYGAAPMSPSKLREAIGVFGPVMAQFYGQAEQVMVCTWLSPHECAEAAADESLSHRLGSCGRPSAVAAVRIVDDEGEPCAVGTVGEIAVKSELRFLGYLNAPEEAARLEVSDGYVRTGDIGYIDADGFVYISDRARDMIVTGGFNVFPSDVERVIWTHPAVEDCAVIGLPDAYWGESVTAVVELKPGAPEATDEILALCREKLGAVSTPKQVIYDVLPRSAVGKVLKRELRDRYSVKSETVSST